MSQGIRAIAAAVTLLIPSTRNHEDAAKHQAMSKIRTERSATRRRMPIDITSPVTGTYKFTVTFADHEALTFFGRTSNIPVTAWGRLPLPSSPSGDNAGGTTMESSFGYHLMVTVNQNLEALTAECTGSQLVRNSAYMAVVNEPATVIDGAQVMRGMLELNLIERAFPDDTLYKGLAKKQTRAPVNSPTRDANARFTLDSNGKLHVEETVQLINGERFVFSGERISPDVLEKCAVR